MNRKRLIVTSVISIILMSILFIGSTYSIFTTTEIDENQNVYTTGNLDITYTLSSDNVKLEDITPTSIEDSIYIKPYRITVTNSGSVPYQFSVALKDTTASNKIDATHIMAQVGKLKPISLTNDQTNIIQNEIVVLPNSSIDIDVRVWLSNNIPNSEIGKNFYARLFIDGLATYTETNNINNDILIAEYKEPILASTHVINLYNDTSNIKSVNISNDLTRPIVYLNEVQGIMLDNNAEYRYYGENPNNYISYNNELWRIISVSNVKSNTSSNKSDTRVKIIKADILKDDNNLSAYSYDSSNEKVNTGNGLNDWSQSDLMNELNNLYYNSQAGNCYIDKNDKVTECSFKNTGLKDDAKNLIADVVYNLGGVKETAELLYANDYYTYEKGSNVNNCTKEECGSTRNTTWTGKIGILYPSDYLYASDLSICTNDTTKYNDCRTNNWLKTDNNEWTITPIIDYVDQGFMIQNNNLTYEYNMSIPSTLRPVAYLKPNVSIVDGKGTELEPYILKN